ncbi:MAG: hypothetical protein R3B72_49640 [Polyangiaceae bacterium]
MIEGLGVELAHGQGRCKSGLGVGSLPRVVGQSVATPAAPRPPESGA